MIKIKKLTLRNFLSIGQNEQSINFDCTDLTLVLGENLDIGENGARNGVGKTTIIQGLSYALFGSAINQIKRDNLINKTNNRAMIATIEFSVNDIEYKIIRGRKPNILKFFINNQEQQIVDDSQGDSRETQENIEKLLQMEPEMFKHIVALNTYNEPFLALKAAEQRRIIEQLLGITLLSERAEKIKEIIKSTRENILEEQYRIKSVEEANKRITEQIDSLKKRQRLWIATKNADIETFTSELAELSKIDIDSELENHKQLDLYNTRHRDIVSTTGKYNQDLANITSKHDKFKVTNKKETDAQLKIIKSLESIVIEQEVENHRLLSLWINDNKIRIEEERWITNCKKSITDLSTQEKKLRSEISKLESHQCYACGQSIHDNQHLEILNSKKANLEEVIKNQELTLIKLKEHERIVDDLGSVKTKPVTHYSTLELALEHKNKLSLASLKYHELTESLTKNITDYEQEIEQIEKTHKDDLKKIGKLGSRPKVHYDTLELALKHQSKVNKLADDLERRMNEQDPYSEQIEDMEQNAIQVISYDTVNEYIRHQQHQEFLLDLLTNKKSFVRKRIIEQNLSYLNNRLTHYLDKIGLPHQVVFQNDLSVEISELGRELDFDNLSRGERNRLIIGLSFAFRDVWESLYSSVNLLFVDELIDNGLDTVGVENSLALLKDMSRRQNKSIWLVSHRDELSSRVSNILKVVKEGGFSSYSSYND